MRTLSDERGSLLVILIIAMTVIAVLGAGFAYIVGSKHEGFSGLVNAQKANMVARGGVDWAIRYASFGTDANSNSIFFSNPTLAFSNKELIPGEPAKGSFATSYSYGSDTLTVNGTYQGTTETITLNNFRRFLSYLTLQPGNNPAYASNRHYLVVPVAINADVTVSRIDLRTDKQYAYLRYITDPEGVVVFNYLTSYYNNWYSNCNAWYSNPPCHARAWDWDESSHTYVYRSVGVLLNPTPSSTELTAPNLTANTLGFSTGTYRFEFYYEGNSPAGLHTIAFNPDGVTSQLAFRP